MKYETIKVIDLQEWDKVVSETYGRPYSFQQQEGCKPRGSFSFSAPSSWTDDYEEDEIPEEVNGDEMGVSFSAWLARDPSQPLSDGRDDFGLGLWWERNFYPDFHMIVNDLHAKGILEDGEYMITIDW